ncbi:hypothetical protein GMORB2_3760 [Geosmithia morbida]|uniref:Uncharacterized protein n=1 Tax=Geosmithia morbida TaxID=1094350 RepID=A0A9P5D5U3_9HYPO|nr:uncharacterized protein GMORB2_3760 [Geosmithia morbida]KAF4124921.1 hypothetical protein GMORB2_3760 [Geosmithia morbida]
MLFRSIVAAALLAPIAAVSGIVQRNWNVSTTMETMTRTMPDDSDEIFHGYNLTVLLNELPPNRSYVLTPCGVREANPNGSAGINRPSRVDGESTCASSNLTNVNTTSIPPDNNTFAEDDRITVTRVEPRSLGRLRKRGSGDVIYGFARQWRRKPWNPQYAGPREWWDLSWQTCRNGRRLDALEGCMSFRALEWLAHIMIAPAELITADSVTDQFRVKGSGGGHAPAILRGVLAWTEILQVLIGQIHDATIVTEHDQMRIMKCYLDYSYQASAFLQALSTRADEFAADDPARCIVFDKIEILYIVYKQVGDLLYSNDPSIRPVLTKQFPAVIPDEWHTKHGAPQPSHLFADYVRTHDWARMGGYESDFAESQTAWKCIETRQQWPQEPRKLERDYNRQKADWLKLEKDIIFDLRTRTREEAQRRRDRGEDHGKGWKTKKQRKKDEKKAKKARKNVKKLKEDGFGDLDISWGQEIWPGFAAEDGLAYIDEY